MPPKFVYNRSYLTSKSNFIQDIFLNFANGTKNSKIDGIYEKKIDFAFAFNLAYRYQPKGSGFFFSIGAGYMYACPSVNISIGDKF